MTAEHPSPNHLFPISTFTTIHGDNESNKIDESKKRKRLLEEEEEQEPIEKSPRRNDYQVEIEQEEEKTDLIVAVTKLNHKERLSAYKRIWENLDLSKPSDAKLEPFVWKKIREYQRK